MSLVRSKDTRPELTVRRLVHRLGYRYRLHARALPGCPDMVFRTRRAVIFVHGCFWHRHKCAMGDRTPKSRVAFWRRKLDGNKRRDRARRHALRRLGWRVLVVWECQVHPRMAERLKARIIEFLGREEDRHAGGAGYPQFQAGAEGGEEEGAGGEVV